MIIWSIVKWIALAVFGWRRTPRHFIVKYARYIPMVLKDDGKVDAGHMSTTCCVALSQLAYLRAANMNYYEQPRYREYVYEMDKISKVVASALAGNEVSDKAVKSILLFHQVV
jgi:hypothetical protein